MNKNTRVHILENGYHIDTSIIIGQRLIQEDEGLYYFELLHKDLKTVFRTESHKSYEYLLMNCINTSNDFWCPIDFFNAYPLEKRKIEILPLDLEKKENSDGTLVLFTFNLVLFTFIFTFLLIIFLCWFFS